MNQKSRSRGQANLLKIGITKKDEVEQKPKRRRVISLAPALVQALVPVKPLSEVPEVGAQKDQFSNIVHLFCAVEKVLNTLHQKKRVPDWETVKESTIRSCGSNLLLSDINRILEIYPDAYTLNWRTIDADRCRYELCIKLPYQFLGKLETRSNMFREKFEAWCLINHGQSRVVVCTSLIPPKPDGLQNSMVKKIPKHSVTLLASMASERRNIAEVENQARGGSGVDNLSRLREMAILRDQSKELRALQELEARVKIESKNRILSLPSLCDALRSKCLSANRTHIKTSELVQHLISELSVTKKELLLRLHIIVDVVPEFLTLIPADHIVPVSTVQLHLHVQYGAVRKKVLAYISSVLEVESKSCLLELPSS